MKKSKIGNFEEYSLIGGLWVLLFLVFFQVVLRYFFKITWNWIEEVCRFLFLWIVWIGAGFAAKHRSHLKIEAFVTLLSPKSQKVANLLSLVIWIIFAAFLAWTGANLTWMLLKRNQLSPVLQIPMGWAYAAVPVGVGLMVFHLFEQLAEMFKPASGSERGDA